MKEGTAQPNWCVFALVAVVGFSCGWGGSQISADDLRLYNPFTLTRVSLSELLREANRRGIAVSLGPEVEGETISEVTVGPPNVWVPPPPPSWPPFGQRAVAVCLHGQIRAANWTAPAFLELVVDALGADVFIATDAAELTLTILALYAPLLLSSRRAGAASHSIMPAAQSQH